LNLHITLLKEKTDMRADVLLVKLGYARSRESAKQMIDSGFVTVNGKQISKPSADIPYSDSCTAPDVSISETPKYVSRGGYKLEGIINLGKINVNDAVCIDIGASTGGFTDCLLQNGAKRVYCIDSGSNQLAREIYENEKTVVHEKTNAKLLTDEHIPEKADVIVMDVSFISQTLIHERVSHFLKDGGLFISLIKPQFELSRSEIKKGGIVKNRKDRQSAAVRVINSCISNDLFPHLLADSSIKGGDGNIEYTAIFKKGHNINYDWLSAIDTLS